MYYEQRTCIYYDRFACMQHDQHALNDVTKQAVSVPQCHLAPPGFTSMVIAATARSERLASVCFKAHVLTFVDASPQELPTDVCNQLSP